MQGLTADDLNKVNAVILWEEGSFQLTVYDVTSWDSESSCYDLNGFEPRWSGKGMHTAILKLLSLITGHEFRLSHSGGRAATGVLYIREDVWEEWIKVKPSAGAG
jgi:hypothetical protein